MRGNSRDRASATQGSAITNTSASIFCLFTATEMWHSRPKEIEVLLSNFSIELSKVSETSTISGHVSNAVHIIARKVI